jgi:hypothetical protein
LEKFRIRGYNSVNLRLGHPTLEIRSPKEVVGYENNTTFWMETVAVVNFGFSWLIKAQVFLRTRTKYDH